MSLLNLIKVKVVVFFFYSYFFEIIVRKLLFSLLNVYDVRLFFSRFFKIDSIHFGMYCITEAQQSSEGFSKSRPQAIHFFLDTFSNFNISFTRWASSLLTQLKKVHLKKVSELIYYSKPLPKPNHSHLIALFQFLSRIISKT